MRRLLAWIEGLGAKRRWALYGVIGAISAGLAAGFTVVDLEQGALAAMLSGLREAWWAPAAVAAVFTALAFIGAPQWVLIAATVAVFGPWHGALLSWGATMVSALVGYSLGRASGLQGALAGGRTLLQRLAEAVARNAFWASLVIRLAPSGPFVVVNVMLGAAGAPWLAFVAGGLGFVPKILIVAFAGEGLSALLHRENLGALALLAVAGSLWALAVFLVAPRLKGWRAS